MLLLGSRSLSWWLGIGGGSGGDLEGNSFDRVLYIALIFASIYIVSKRGIDWASIIQRNKALLLLYLFLFATIMWSPYPFVTFRRWFKDLGAIFLILVILTEQNPLEATKAIFARCAYVWFPLSEIFAKYFPAIGREYSRGGGTMYTGVTSQKNSLGEIILVVCLFLISELAQANRPREAKFLRGHHFTIFFTLAMGLWLLYLCNSKTALICLVIGTAIVLGHKLPLFRGHPQRVLTLVLVAVPLYFVADNMFKISDDLLSLVGRDSTLTERTLIWDAIKQNPADPVFGSGYMMYWDVHKGRVEAGDITFSIKTAHNGYLETYLDGGTLGICFLIIMLAGVGIRAIRVFLTDSEYGRLALAFYVAMLVYNYSEATFARRCPIWFAFLLFSLEFRGYIPSPVPEERTVVDDFAFAGHETVGSGRA
jgi:O-antigen ligase